MKNQYVNCKGRDEVQSFLEQLYNKGYDTSALQGTDLDRNMIIHVRPSDKVIEEITLTSLHPAEIESYIKKAITPSQFFTEFDSQESKQGTDQPKLKFISISPRQIVSRFDDKFRKEADGSPLRVCKVLLPSSQFSKNPLTVNGEVLKNPTIIVPEFTVREDKFTEGRKVIGLKADYEYSVSYDTNKKDDNGHVIRERIKVSGERLKEAFDFKPRERSLHQRIDSAEEQKQQAQASNPAQEKQREQNSSEKAI